MAMRVGQSRGLRGCVDLWVGVFLLCWRGHLGMDEGCVGIMRVVFVEALSLVKFGALARNVLWSH